MLQVRNPDEVEYQEEHGHGENLDEQNPREDCDEQNLGNNQNEQNLEQENGDNCTNENPGYDLRDRSTITHPHTFADYELYLTSQEDIPLSYETCATDPNWKKAIEDEKHEKHALEKKTRHGI